MNKYTRLLVVQVYVCLQLFCSTAIASVEMLRFSVFDADSGEMVSARITVNDTVLTGRKYLVSREEESSVVMRVHADAGNEYYSREMTIFLAGLDRRPIFYIYLAKRSHEKRIYSRGNVYDASKYIGDRTQGDRAVALLDRMEREAGDTLKNVTQFWVYFNYNLASAYYNSCTTRFVDQCNKSEKILANLISNFYQYKRFFDNEKITIDKLKDPEVDLFSSKYIYQKILWEIQRNCADEAQNALDILRAKVDADQTLCSRLRIPLNSLDDLSKKVDLLRLQPTDSPAN
nr:hypothetical protein [uncultured Desulfobulbus sp.]